MGRWGGRGCVGVGVCVWGGGSGTRSSAPGAKVFSWTAQGRENAELPMPMRMRNSPTPPPPHTHTALPTLPYPNPSSSYGARLHLHTGPGSVPACSPRGGAPLGRARCTQSSSMSAGTLRASFSSFSLPGRTRVGWVPGLALDLTCTWCSAVSGSSVKGSLSWKPRPASPLAPQLLSPSRDLPPLH